METCVIHYDHVNETRLRHFNEHTARKAAFFARQWLEFPGEDACISEGLFYLEMIDTPRFYHPKCYANFTHKHRLFSRQRQYGRGGNFSGTNGQAQTGRKSCSNGRNGFPADFDEIFSESSRDSYESTSDLYTSASNAASVTNTSVKLENNGHHGDDFINLPMQTERYAVERFLMQEPGSYSNKESPWNMRSGSNFPVLCIFCENVKSTKTITTTEGKSVSEKLSVCRLPKTKQLIRRIAGVVGDKALLRRIRCRDLVTKKAQYHASCYSAYLKRGAKILSQRRVVPPDINEIKKEAEMV